MQQTGRSWRLPSESILFERLPDPCLMVHGGSGCIVDCNAALTQATGHVPTSIVGLRVQELAADDGAAPVWCCMAGAGDFPDSDVSVLTQRGTARAMSARGTALPCLPGRPRLGLVRLRDLARQRAGEQALQDDLRHWRRRAQQAQLAQDRERERIAADLHDDIGQTLAMAALKLHALCGRAGSDDARAGFDELRALIDDAARATRRATFALADPLLPMLGLKAALQGAAGRMLEDSPLEVQFDGDDFGAEPAQPLVGVLYRVTRELMHNVVKHAHAHTLRVTLWCEPAHWCVRVLDDGIGCPPARLRRGFGPQGGFGLVSVATQLRVVGGRLRLGAAPGGGTLALVRVPRAEA